VKEINQQGTKFFAGALEAAGSASAGRRSSAPRATSPICLGSFSGGAFVPPSDIKTSEAQAKLIARPMTRSRRSVAAATAGQIASIFACPGSSSIADLQKCLECGGLNGTFDALEQQYAERRTFVAWPGAIQTAVSGGCGRKAPHRLRHLRGRGHGRHAQPVDRRLWRRRNARPKIIEPGTVVSGQGFRRRRRQAGPQSLDSSTRRATASSSSSQQRPSGTSPAAAPPHALRRDRATATTSWWSSAACGTRPTLLVGQSSTIVVRFNDVRLGVSGIEIENSGNAQVCNYGAGNTAGLLVFQDAACRCSSRSATACTTTCSRTTTGELRRPGAPSPEPTGLGILVISADDAVRYNLLRGNNTAGLVLTDQIIASFGPPFSTDESVDGNFVFNNVMSGNGLAPTRCAGRSRWRCPASTSRSSPHNRAATASGNTFATDLGFSAFHSGTNTGTCVLPPPAVFDLPGAADSSTTTTTPTTSTTTTT
jgi:hypothetical protein